MVPHAGTYVGSKVKTEEGPKPKKQSRCKETICTLIALTAGMEFLLKPDTQRTARYISKQGIKIPVAVNRLQNSRNVKVKATEKGQNTQNWKKNGRTEIIFKQIPAIRIHM